MTLFTTDPTDTHYEFKETEFCDIENPTKEDYEIEINRLSKIIKAKNEAIEFLIFETSDHLTHQIRKLTQIRKI